MKLATFVDGSFYHNNKKENCYKIVRRRRKKCIKLWIFFEYILSALEIVKTHISRFFCVIGQLNCEKSRFQAVRNITARLPPH